MTERMVEVEWEDSAATQGWQTEDDLPQPSRIRSEGYIRRDDEEGILLIESLSEKPEVYNPYQIVKDLGCAMAIPRSAIRNVWELRRKR